MKSFEDTLTKMLEIHKAKNQDYADPINPFSNFDVSHYILSLFNNDRDKAFVWPIATKLARLATLLNSNRTPNNESIEDSLVDCANYFILWKCDLERRRKNNSESYVLPQESCCSNCGVLLNTGYLAIMTTHGYYCSPPCRDSHRP